MARRERYEPKLFHLTIPVYVTEASGKNRRTARSHLVFDVHARSPQAAFLCVNRLMHLAFEVAEAEYGSDLFENVRPQRAVAAVEKSLRRKRRARR